MTMRRIASTTAAALLLATLLAGQAGAQTGATTPAAPRAPAPAALAPVDVPAAQAPAASDATTPGALLANGATAPDFTVQDRNGKPVKLSDYKGKTVVLDFWATWCGPCQISLPRTNAIAEKFMKQNVIVLAINVSDTASAFQAWLAQHAKYGSLKFAFDPAPSGQDVGAAKYGVSDIPTQFVISPKGKIVASFDGFDLSDMSEGALQKAIQAAKAP